MEETKTLFEPGEIITFLELVKKAAAYKGLTFWEGAKEAVSRPFAVYVLDDKLLAFLAARNIKRQMRPDTRNEIFTLVDENLQELVPGWAPSNYWNFKLVEGGKKKEYDLKIELSVGFGVSMRDRSISLYPQAHGTFLSASDHLPNFRMFKALVESTTCPELLSVALEIAASSGHIIVTFTELGLGGIRRLVDLFYEFSSGREPVLDLAHQHAHPFDPEPYPSHQNPGDEIWITEPAQPKLFDLWRKQLKNYRSALAV